MRTTSPNSRYTAALAVTGALGFAVEGAIALRSPQPDHHWDAAGYAVEVAFAIALAATIPLVPRLRTPGSRAARIGAAFAMAGFGAMLVQGLVSIPADGDVLGPVFFFGLLAALAGLLALTVVAVRHRGERWWAAPLVLTALVAGIALGDHGGGLLIGLAWLALAVAWGSPRARYRAGSGSTEPGTRSWGTRIRT